MKKIAAGFLLVISVLGVTSANASAKKCIGYCPGVSSKAGNPYNVYKPRNTYVAPYVQPKTGRFVQGYTRSTPFGK